MYKLQTLRSLNINIKYLKFVNFFVAGFPILGVEWQKMENPDLRMAMGMGPDQKGVRIRRVEPTAPESHVLKPSDVILSFDGINIANDGTGQFYFVYLHP